MPIYTPGKLTLAKAFTWNETVWNPSMITTALWLDANDSGTVIQSGGAVTTWNDKSGNGSNATAAGNPTYSATGMSTSKPAVQLDGTDDRFVSSITGIGSFNALDVYMVVQSTTAAAADVNSAVFWTYGNINNGSGSYPANKGLGLGSATGAFSGETILCIYENSTVFRLGSTTYSRPANTTQLLQSSYSTAGTVIRSNASTVSLDLSLNSMTTSTNTAPSSIGYTVDSDLHIAAARAIGSLSASPAIKFGEFIVLSTTASTNTRQRIEGYLAHKWGLTANLPSDHPYKTVGPTP